MQKTTTFTSPQIMPVLALLCYMMTIIFQSCQKSMDHPVRDGIVAGKKPPKNQPPPPPPPPFYFNNCSYPSYSGTFTAGVAANVTVTLNYVNSPGGSYAAYTSSTVNGITVSAPAGSFNTGSGSILFTLAGTPVVAGHYYISVAVGSIIPCNLLVTVLNAPANPATCGGDPGATLGSTGCVSFNYRGQSVTYFTVRANDGKIWLQQNLGSPQVAFDAYDEASFGHYFQWGRWDDGHQLRNSALVYASPSLNNPSHIPSGNPNFIRGLVTTESWWGTGGMVTDTWSGTTATATNGKDPCAVLGSGWRMPTKADWQQVLIAEDLSSTLAAYMSNLKLPTAGYRLFDGGVFTNFTDGYYWSGTAEANSNASTLFFDNNYNGEVLAAQRGNGFPCRCVKD